MMNLIELGLLLIAAFGCGWLACSQTTIIRNARQIRWNSEMIRRQREDNEALFRRPVGKGSGDAMS